MDEQDLNHLSLNQMETAFKFLLDKHELNPPKELQHLKNKDWLLLQELLLSLELEKSQAVLH